MCVRICCLRCVQRTLEESATALVLMGFEEDAVWNALADNGGQLEPALAALLAADSSDDGDDDDDDDDTDAVDGSGSGTTDTSARTIAGTASSAVPPSAVVAATSSAAPASTSSTLAPAAAPTAADAESLGEALGAKCPSLDGAVTAYLCCLLYTSPSPRDRG